MKAKDDKKKEKRELAMDTLANTTTTQFNSFLYALVGIKTVFYNEFTDNEKELYDKLLKSLKETGIGIVKLALAMNQENNGKTEEDIA